MSEWSEVNDREVHCISCVACMQGQCRGNGCTPDGLLDIHLDVQQLIRYLSLIQTAQTLPVTDIARSRIPLLVLPVVDVQTPLGRRQRLHQHHRHPLRLETLP